MNAEKSFLKNLFSKYYCGVRIPAPKNIELREFGFILFEIEGMVRHLSFKNELELNNYLKNKVPLHAYYSSAYYKFPNAEDMDSKEWIGADLVFDIDADHIPTPCKDEHDKWTCLDCGYSSTGMAPESCPKCKSKRIKAETWLCEQCLDVAKNETFKLIDEFLVADFGISIHEMSINFSGHRGYHVHVYSEVVRKLSQDARREITDYIRGIGFSPKIYGFTGRDLIENPLDLADPGWRGRLARGIYDFISRADLSDFKKLSIRSRTAKKIIENRDLILKSLESNPPIWPSISGISMKTWSKIAQYVVKVQGSHIDERVTTDIKRLMRLPETLHGKTGFKVKSLSYNELENFDPLVDAVVFRRGEVKVHVHECPELTINNETYGPYNNEDVIIPLALAVYLLCKGAAEIIEES